MKTIIVPTDFSDNAGNALTFACEFNKKFNARILLLHSYHLPLPSSDYPIIPVTDQEIRKIAIDGLNETKTTYELKFPGMAFETEATLGMATEEIESYAKKTNCDLIIMGTHGASGVKEFMLGTNTAAVIEKAPCPVLTVPENATFNGMKTIVFAADYGNHNFNHMQKIIDLAKLFDSEIILLHVSSGKAEATFEDSEIGRFKERIANESNFSKISYRVVEDEDTFHAINSYLDQSLPGLLAMSMRHRSLVQKIFSRSLTKRMTYHSQVPVLALHISN